MRTAICACIKNEHDDIVDEWLRWHFHIGIDHVYLYDDDSEVPVEETVTDFRDRVTVYRNQFIEQDNRQKTYYNFILHDARKHFDWLAYIDLDEFIVLKQNDQIQEFLETYNEYGAVVMFWSIFNSNQHIERPTPGLIAHYDKVVREENFKDLYVKSIINTKYAKTMPTVHSGRFVEGKYAVTDQFKELTGSFTQDFSLLSKEKIQLNHYYTKSLACMIRKHERGSAVSRARVKPISILERYDAMSHYTDETLIEQSKYLV